MVLSDRSIRESLDSGHIVVDPLGEGCIQPASVDIRIDRHIRVFLAPEEYSVVDVRTNVDGITKPSEIPDPAPYVLEPGEFILANTIENVELPADVVARLEGKSSLGRLGLMVHATAGYVDPGFKGQLTLEISNVARARISIFYGMKIGQISFLRLTTPAENPYGSGLSAASTRDSSGRPRAGSISTTSRAAARAGPTPPRRPSCAGGWKRASTRAASRSWPTWPEWSRRRRRTGFTAGTNPTPPTLPSCTR